MRNEFDIEEHNDSSNKSQITNNRTNLLTLGHAPKWNEREVSPLAEEYCGERHYIILCRM